MGDELNVDLLPRGKSKLFEELNVLGRKVIAVLLKESVFLGREGDIAEL